MEKELEDEKKHEAEAAKEEEEEVWFGLTCVAQQPPQGDGCLVLLALACLQAIFTIAINLCVHILDVC